MKELRWEVGESEGLWADDATGGASHPPHQETDSSLRREIQWVGYPPLHLFILFTRQYIIDASNEFRY